MYKIAICDDDTVFSAELQDQLSRILKEKDAEHQITKFGDPKELMRSIEEGKSYDLVFQDILFGTEKGLRFVKLMRERRWNADVIFITSSADYAVESYDVYPLHYLLKPVSRERLVSVMEHFLEKNKPQTLRFRTARGIFQFQLTDILYFEVYDHDVVIHKTDGDQISFQGSLRDVENSLPLGSFVRSHRSYLVNLGHILEVMRYKIRLSSGETVPISKRSYQDVIRSLISYDDKTSTIL